MVLVVGNVHKGLFGKVNVLTSRKGATVIDGHHYRFVVGQVGHLYFRAKRKLFMRSGIFAVAEGFAIRRFLSIELISIVAGYRFLFIGAERTFRRSAALKDYEK